MTEPYSKDNPEGNPWTFLSETEIHTSPWINVYTHQVLNVVGREHTYNLVRFQNLAVGIVPLHDDGTLTLVGQYRYATGSYSWELPEGGCPLGRDPRDMAEVELAEETGLRAKHYRKILEMHLSNAVSDEWAEVFLATGLTQGEASPEENEVLQTRRVTLDALLDEIEAGNITDAITVAAAYKLAVMKMRGAL